MEPGMLTDEPAARTWVLPLNRNLAPTDALKLPPSVLWLSRLRVPLCTLIVPLLLRRRKPLPSVDTPVPTDFVRVAFALLLNCGLVPVLYCIESLLTMLKLARALLLKMAPLPM